MIVIVGIGCRYTGGQKEHRKKNPDRLQEISKDKTTTAETSVQYQELTEEIVNSLLDSSLSDAYDIAMHHFQQLQFDTSYAEGRSCNFNIDVSINKGYLFTEDKAHLIIRQHNSWFHCISIHKTDSDGFTKVLSHQQDAMEFLRDSIRDINGDGLKDLEISWYGSAGCCLKTFSTIYLLQADESAFSKAIKFINPTFSPEEHLVRGVTYGHPGGAKLYKRQWQGDTAIIVETVSFEDGQNSGPAGTILLIDERPGVTGKGGQKNKRSTGRIQAYRRIRLVHGPVLI
ncbi:hypothetical protein [Flavihumibacter petaseus]|uniref:Uncharacterized protein n=1 Tax=Flavihumibacter petaseus NBRC 106054 TaxID=1220578 RepID=A0A0E9N149_9BACT|nr:hypothetical protein [Flavihumibacter petaseus]GAO43584.1 hypothetical protein FPE01S_02_06900 [Flavihumibacter petaseus NBRC 106054]